MPEVPVLRDYQRKGVQHLLDTPDACLFQCPGLGKTLQVLLAYLLILRKTPKLKMLVIAPLRVAQTVWKVEAAKWEPTEALQILLLHGKEKNKWVKYVGEADICLINYEGLAWLEKALDGQQWPWDIIVYDELTKCKSVSTARARWIRRHHEKFGAHWGLTGTPMSTKGYQDLFGQIRAIDGGKALGTGKYKYDELFFYYKSQYDRELYLKPNAAEIITQRISPIVYQLKAEDHLQMPEKMTIHHDIPMKEGHWEVYNDLETTMMLDYQDKEITAASAGVLWGKLLQVLQGFVYTDMKETAWFNQDKIDVLVDIIEESAGAPVLVFYHFRAEAEQLALRFPEGTVLTRNNAETVVEAWCDNRIPILFANPLSAGHGLNLQTGGANTIVWLCQNGSPEIYIQAVGRLWRQGQRKESVVIHHINMRSPRGTTIDDDIIKMLENRSTVQEVMLRRLGSLQRSRSCVGE